MNERKIEKWTFEIHKLLRSKKLSDAAWRETNEVWRLLSNLPSKEDFTGPLGHLLDDHDEKIEVPENARKIFEEIYEEFCEEKPEEKGNLSTAWCSSNAIRGKYNDEKVLDTFRKEFETDGDTEFDQILYLYQKGTKEERKLINAVFTHLCGWSIPSLVKISKGGEVK